MCFAVILPGTRSVEISQAGIAQAVETMEPIEHALDDQFRLSIGICGMERRRFCDGRLVRIAVEGRRGQK